MMPVYKRVLGKADEKGMPISLMVYSGDDDAICATLGSQEWIWNMGFIVTEEWQPVTLDGQVAGMTVKFVPNKDTQTNGLRFTTVHGAGHMAPSTRPAQTLEIIRKFLQNDF